MNITFNSVGTHDYKIDYIKPGELRMTHAIDGKLFRRKLNSDAQFEWVGDFSQGRFLSEKIEENYEYQVYHQDRLIDSCELNHSMVWEQPNSFYARTNRLINRLPDNIYQKRNPDSNTNKIVRSIVRETEEFDRQVAKLAEKKQYRPMNPLGMNVINSFKVKDETDVFWNGKFLKKTNKMPMPVSYQYVMMVSKLAFGYDQLHTESVDYFSDYVDETTQTHPLSLVWNYSEKRLDIQSKQTGDIFFSAEIFSPDWKRIIQIDGIDCTTEQLFILSDYKLYVFPISVPLKDPFIASHQIDVERRYPISGLKIGDGFFVTRQFQQFAIYQNRSLSAIFDMENKEVHTFGDVNYLEKVDLEDMDIYLPYKRVNISNSIDEAFLSFGLERVEGISTGVFLAAASAINFEQILNHNDSISNIIDNTESSVVFREAIQNFKTAYELPTDMAETILKKFYDDNIQSVKWGVSTW